LTLFTANGLALRFAVVRVYGDKTIRRGYSLKYLVGAFLRVFVGLVLATAAWAEEVTITSVGQTSDGMLVKVLMKGMAVDPGYNSGLTAQSLGSQKALIVVVGGSSKGLGAAGVTLDQERSRAKLLLQEARKRGIRVLLMHIGGARRRGELTDTFIEATVGLADRLVVVAPGNLDGIFSKGRASGATLTEVDTPRAAVPVVSSTLQDWGLK